MGDLGDPRYYWLSLVGVTGELTGKAVQAAYWLGLQKRALMYLYMYEARHNKKIRC